MSEKRSAPRPTQKIVADSLERMARASTNLGLEPLVAKPLAEEPPPVTPRMLANTVRRADLAGLGVPGGPTEDDWGEIAIAEGSGGIVDDAVVVDEPIVPSPPPVRGRVSTVDDPLTMAMLAEVARSSKTSDFDPTVLDEVQRHAQGAKLEDAPPAPVAAHPRLKRRDS